MGMWELLENNSTMREREESWWSFQTRKKAMEPCKRKKRNRGK